MKLTKRIDQDCKCLESYFQKLFYLMQEAIAEDSAAPIKQKMLMRTNHRQPIMGSPIS